MKSNYMHLALVTVIAMGSAPSFADEVQLFCEMTKAQADIQQQLLGSSQLFTTLGNPQTGISNTITAGVSKSLSRHIQAKTSSTLADATCDAYRADHILAEQTKNVEQRSMLVAIDAMEQKLQKALDQANANITKEKQMLAMGASTLMDVKAAYDARLTVRSMLADMAQSRARFQDQLKEAEQPLNILVDKAIASHAKVASVTAQLAAQTGWDVSIAAGAQTDTKTRGTSSKAFVGVNFSYSFGQPAANRISATVEGLAAQYAREQRDGPLIQLQRAITTVKGLIVAEDVLHQGWSDRRELAEDTIKRVTGIDSDDAQRAMRSATLEKLIAAAQQAGSETRMQYLRGWLARNGDPAK